MKTMRLIMKGKRARIHYLDEIVKLLKAEVKDEKIGQSRGIMSPRTKKGHAESSVHGISIRSISLSRAK
jgi:hypothetical protein